MTHTHTPFIRAGLAGLVVLLALTAAGCAVQGPKQEAGMIIGGIVGGIVGNQVGGGSGRRVATVLGALAGGALGGAIGRSMDDVDRMKMAATLKQPAPVCRPPG